MDDERPHLRLHRRHRVPGLRARWLGDGSTYRPGALRASWRRFRSSPIMQAHLWRRSSATTTVPTSTPTTTTPPSWSSAGAPSCSAPRARSTTSWRPPPPEGADPTVTTSVSERPRRRRRSARRAPRRPRRRRRPVRHRRRPPPAADVPVGALRHLRGARRHRRHVGPVPVPRHPLRLRHVHARLLAPPVDGARVDRRRCVDPAVHPRHGRPSRASTTTSGSTTASCGADWSTADARWTVTAERTDTGETVQVTAGFLFSCSGYYRYDQGYTPDFAGRDRLPRARSSTRRPGPTISTTPASASW